MAKLNNKKRKNNVFTKKKRLVGLTPDRQKIHLLYVKYIIC